MSDLAWTAPPPPIYVELDAFLALGMADEFLPGQGTQIGALWSRFVPRIGEITGRVGTHTYGICCPLEDVRECDRFSYVAAVQVRSLAAIPDGMTGVSMPASRCAVFSHTLGLGPALQQTMRYIFGEWLPASGHESAAPDFEYYDDRFDPATGTGELLIYVPIARS